MQLHVRAGPVLLTLKHLHTVGDDSTANHVCSIIIQQQNYNEIQVSRDVLLMNKLLSRGHW